MNELRTTSLDSLESDSWSAEAEANRLMDDVFADIDQLLGDRQPPQSFRRSPEPEIRPMQSVLVTQGDLMGPPPEEPPFPPEEIDAELVVKRGWGYYTERLLFICSCASLVGGILWLAANDQLKMPQFLSRSTPPATETVPPESPEPGTEFANYIQRALDNIDRQADTEAPASEANSGPQVIERIYIPVYPPNAGTNGSANLSQGLALLPPPPSVEPPVAIAPPPPPKQNSDPLAIVPPPAPRAVTPTVNDVPAPPTAPKTMYSLVGVLEAGDRSEALFKINGTTQRFRLGEELGSGSWKLIGAQSNQVILERAGQTRTVYVGQDFPSN
ncbi:hypothetical protein [Picosynechococcus sp. PCC 7117]|uniref:hypothetical protein n=1 Tax=Picosynechococcus sp. PCC 7117 TaxID=195498 RepID=UPI0008109153|nr:hypothetical protein [Picosynechococcus sp. PCC 7117]ANV87345.1 hypothetical protein AWQ22_07665 [Picosynechococcus sp. PCC 7117]